MKTALLRSLVISALVFSAAPAFAQDASADASKSGGLLKDFDTLGGNDVLLDKARALNPDSTISVVQDRVVSRRKRVELAPEFTNVLGGDAYNHTSGFALNAYFHINPHWALGAKYEYDTNSLRPEGEFLINDTTATGKGIIPEIDFPTGQALALVNFFPIYGKMNLYDLGVVHFDIYAVGGGGQVFLHSGNKTTYTAGGGIGFWFSQHLTTRAELRYQGYKAKRLDEETQMNLTVASLQIGYLF